MLCYELLILTNVAGSLKGSKRILPFIPGKQVFRHSTKNLTLDRQPELDRYIKELIGLPEHVSQSSYVRRFLSEEHGEDRAQYVKGKNGDQDQRIEDADEKAGSDGVVHNEENTS